MARVSQTFTIDGDDIMDTLAEQLSHEELVSFVKGLDTQVADWDFTNELIAYFKEQEEIFLEEEGWEGGVPDPGIK